MIIVDPVPLGDASLSGGGGSYYDKVGVLQTAAPGTPRLTYDPADLSKPPALMLEPAATNHIRNNTMQGVVAGTPGAIPTNWVAGQNAGLSTQVLGASTEDGIEFVDVRIYGTVASVALPEFTFVFDGYNVIAASIGQKYCSSIYARMVAGSLSGVTDCEHFIIGFDANGITEASHSTFNLDNGLLRTNRKTHERTLTGATTAFVVNRLDLNFTAGGGQPIDVTLRIGLPQLERDRVTSPIKTAHAAVTRATDVVSTTAGLLYSNVPETEPLWVAGTYALGAKVRNAAHVVYESLAASNTAALTDAAKWLKLGATDRWAMFDDRNNTQTSNPEEIVVALSPRAIAQGLLLGNLDASEIGIAVTVPNFGVVYRETHSLIVTTSNSSFFRWAFKRIRRKTLFLSLSLPIFFNGVATVSIRRPGGIAKCGMCLIGPTVEPGPTLVGLSTEIKDYSTTSFNVDGSSSTIERGYRKLMSMDVSIDTEKIVEAEEQMIAWKQKTVAWVGAAGRPDTVLVGRYSSFKKVIESYPRSKMALQIEGVLS